MGWEWYSALTDTFKRRTGKYLINKYLGPYLEDGGILTDQLVSVDSDVSLREVALNINKINELLEDFDLPFEFVDGFIGELTVRVPWKNLLQENCFFAIDGLTITLQIRKREHPAQISASIFHSMCESFSSMDVAEECLREQEDGFHGEKDEGNKVSDQGNDNENSKVRGVELVAQAIDSIMMRVKVTLKNTTIRIEHVPTLEARGIALELKIGKILYAGELGQPGVNAPELSSSHFQSSTMVSSTIKKIFLEDVSLFSDDFTFTKSSGDDPMASMVMNRSCRRSSGESSNSDNQEDQQTIPPLQLASLSGSQELLIKFQELNQFGLPRAIEEIEISLGGLSLHLFPHQIHTLSEIISAISVPPSKHENVSSVIVGNRECKTSSKRLESLLQKSMMNPQRLGMVTHQGWACRESMEQSCDFHPVSGTQESHIKGSTEVSSYNSDIVMMPRIVIRMVSLSAVLLEKDFIISKLGGEDTKAKAMSLMREAASSFFNSNFKHGVSAGQRLEMLQTKLLSASRASNISVAAASISVVHEDGSSIISRLKEDHQSITTVTVKQASVMEVIFDETIRNEPFEIVEVLKFSPCLSTHGFQSPDIKLTYKETSSIAGNVSKSEILVQLNTCFVDFDPGIVDRTYLIFNYPELDPNVLLCSANSNSRQSSSSKSDFSLTLSSPHFILQFHVPKVDLRHPKDIPRFVESFWMRQVHQEIFELKMKDFKLTLDSHAMKQGADVGLRCNEAILIFQESKDSEKMPLLRIAKTSTSDLNSHPAAVIRVNVCMDESKKLQGKYSSEKNRRRTKSERESAAFQSGSFFVSEGGHVTGGDKCETQSNIFAQQLKFLDDALEFGRNHNNLLIDLQLDQVSLLLPSKRVYEVIYNRLGNDMLLWIPKIFTVKEFLYDQPLPDPLVDPDLGFSTNFSGRTEKMYCDNLEKCSSRSKNASGTRTSYVSFPRDTSAALNIHIDTCVNLSVRRLHGAITSENGFMEDPLHSNYEIANKNVLYANLGGFSLNAIVGLERDPEVVILKIIAQDIEVRFGEQKNSDDFNNFHHAPTNSLHNLDLILSKSQFGPRVWLNPCESEQMLSLTSKILFDSKANLKTINMALSFQHTSLTGKTILRPPMWALWLAEFFTVVEYPVNGYLPPAILTELQFEIQQSTIEMKPTVFPAELTLTLGQARVTCNLLDSVQEVGIVIKLEDICLFLARDIIDSIENSVCFADIDYLDLEINLREHEGKNEAPFMDVVTSCNRLRVRTCPDTIQMLSDMIQALMEDQQIYYQNGFKADSSFNQRSGESRTACTTADEPILGVGSVDIASTMEEIIDIEIAEKQILSDQEIFHLNSQSEREGTQLFYFPNENQSRENKSNPKDVLQTSALMAESVFGPSSIQDVTLESEPDSMEEFCILDDEIGTGITSKSGIPSCRSLDPDEPVLIMHPNRFERPSKTINFLKIPDFFPKFQFRVTLRRFSGEWQLFGGNDFSTSKSMAVNTKSRLGLCPRSMSPTRTKTSDEEVLSSISSPSRIKADELKTRGGPGRNLDQQIMLLITKLQFTHEIYPKGHKEVSRKVLIVPQIEIHDRHFLSQINKLLHLYSCRSRPKQSNANMLSIRCLQTLSHDQSIETSIQVSAQPMRLNLDQDTLFFLMDFFGTLNPSENGSTMRANQKPIVSYGQVVAYNQGMEAIEVTEEVGREEMEPDFTISTEANISSDFSAATARKSPGPFNDGRPKTSETYIRSFIFSPDVLVRIDYSAKYVDLTQGAFAGLLAGLTSLNCSELTLKSVSYQNGILGYEKLVTLLVTEWMTDIRQNQIPRLLGGVGPMYSVLQLIQGIKDLILLPFEQYQKDGRILRGIQRGTNSFTSSTAVSFLDFSNKMLGIIKFAAEMTYEIMSPESSVIKGKLPHQGQRRCHYNQLTKPADLREGFFNAFSVVREGLDEAAKAITEAASNETARSRGFTQTVGGVLRQVPSSLVRPVIVATVATANVLEGVQSQVAPDLRKDEEDKWRVGGGGSNSNS